MLKVLHFYKTYYPDTFGGVEQVIYQLSESGAAYGIDSTVLSLSKRGDNDNKIGSHRVCYAKTNFEIASTPFSFSSIRKFAELAKEADIIHYHFPFPFMDMLHFICRIKKPTVVSYHSDIVRQKSFLRLYAPLMNMFLRRVDCIVASSPNYVYTSLTLQKYLHKVKVISYGLKESSYPICKSEKLDYWRNKFGENFFLFVGTLRYYKGLHVLLEAATRPELKIVIVGSGTEEQKLKSKAKELGLSNINFVGAVTDEDKSALLTLCYCVVFPSHLRSEAFGISLVEGAMHAKPLISAEIGTGTSFINVDGLTGLVVTKNSPEELRTAMLKMLADPDKADAYGRNAYERYLNLFTAEKMTQEYQSVYLDIIKGN